MRALLVEDSPDVARHVAQVLTQAGFVVDRSGDGEDAWFRGDTEDYDVVILDLGLPRLDGLTVLKRWRGAGRLFPVLILSARGDWIEKVEGIDCWTRRAWPRPSTARRCGCRRWNTGCSTIWRTMAAARFRPARSPTISTAWPSRPMSTRWKRW
jgi:CheY-like chemotaxis protein